MVCGIDLYIYIGSGTSYSCFFLEKGARVLYLEKHIGTGGGAGARVINPVTDAELAAIVEDLYVDDAVDMLDGMMKADEKKDGEEK